MRVDQFVPTLVRHDAIGNHVREISRLLRGAGIDSDVFYETVDPALRRTGRPYTEWSARDRDTILLYHASTNSSMAGWLSAQASAGRRVFSNYHNITPAAYFDFWLPQAAVHMTTAREELGLLAPVTELGIADSHFNEEELVAAGYPRTATCSLLVDLERYHDAPDRRVLERLRRRRDGGGADWLFVGRIAPNKCQHDVVAAFAVFRRLFDPKARLTLVGGPTGQQYRRAVQRMVSELDLDGGVEMLEGVGHAELLAHFRTADVFVCLSEHEGFCVPVLEAMELGLPVVALAAAALPETIGDGGVLLGGKDPVAVACVVHDLLGDEERRSALAGAGRRRAGELSLPRSSARLLDTLTASV